MAPFDAGGNAVEEAGETELEALIAAMRQLFGDAGAMRAATWPVRHAALVSLGRSWLFLAVFVPRCIHR